MSHLSEERLFELGLEPDPAPTASEAQHLADCADCAESLATERSFSAELEALPMPEAPANFVLMTRGRFDEAQAARHARHTFVAVSLALAAGLLVTLPLVGVLVGSAETLVLQLGHFVQTVATLGRALAVVGEAVPMVPLLFTAAAGTACAMIATLLSRLAVATATWK